MELVERQHSSFGNDLSDMTDIDVVVVAAALLLGSCYSLGLLSNSER